MDEKSPVLQDKDDDRIPCRILKDCGLNGEVHLEGHVGLVSPEFFRHHYKLLKRLERSEYPRG